VRVTVEPNGSLRSDLRDAGERAKATEGWFDRSTIIALPIPVFCEFSWALGRSDRQTASQIADAIQAICAIETVVTDDPAVDAGIKALRAGGDFADGAIAQQGQGLGGTVLATFDQRALSVLRKGGLAAADPSELAN